jgi:hypothetical protein
MERPVSAIRGNPARRNQGVERPVLAHQRRTHAAPEPTVVVSDIFTVRPHLARRRIPHTPPHRHLHIHQNLLTQTTLTAHTPKCDPFQAGDSSATSSATKRGVSASLSTATAARANEGGEVRLELGISRLDPEAELDPNDPAALLHHYKRHHPTTTTPICSANGSGGNGGGLSDIEC